MKTLNLKNCVLEPRHLLSFFAADAEFCKNARLSPDDCALFHEIEYFVGQDGTTLSVVFSEAQKKAFCGVREEQIASVILVPEVVYSIGLEDPLIIPAFKVGDVEGGNVMDITKRLNQLYCKERGEYVIDFSKSFFESTIKESLKQASPAPTPTMSLEALRKVLTDEKSRNALTPEQRKQLVLEYRSRKGIWDFLIHSQLLVRLSDWRIDPHTHKKPQVQRRISIDAFCDGLEKVKGNTLLHRALLRNDLANVRFLLKLMPKNQRSVLNKEGNSPEKLAADPKALLKRCWYEAC